VECSRYSESGDCKEDIYFRQNIHLPAAMPGRQQVRPEEGDHGSGRPAGEGEGVGEKPVPPGATGPGGRRPPAMPGRQRARALALALGASKERSGRWCRAWPWRPERHAGRGPGQAAATGVKQVVSSPAPGPGAGGGHQDEEGGVEPGPGVLGGRRAGAVRARQVEESRRPLRPAAEAEQEDA
jgi:hypothetical protein